jgi:RHS repeat-associated protein
VLDYDYNSLGLVTQVAETIDAATGATTAYAYDDLHRLASVTQTGGASGLTATDRRADFAWNNAGQLTDIARYAGLDAMSDPPVAATHFDYETGGRLASITHTLNDGTPGTQIDYGYTWDGANRLTEIDSSQDGLSTFDHDDAGQLTAEDHDGTANPHTADHDYAYDDNGNRLTVTVDGGPPEDWETDRDNRLLFDGTYTYTYDAEGNRTARFIDVNEDGSITTNTDTDVTTYHWDHRNRLTAVAFDTDGDGQLDKRVEYTYDVFDQLIGKTVDDDGDGNADRAEIYVWDRGQILLDFVDDDASSGIDPVGLDDFTLARRYLHGPLVDQVLAQENVAAGPGNENVDWLLADHQGTVRDIVRWDDTAGETITVTHFTYDTFGNVTSGDTTQTRYLYTGRDWDADTGLQYNRARWYDPATGRWISEDPIGFSAGDPNLARYVGNGATYATDPSGLQVNPAMWVEQELGRFGGDCWKFLVGGWFDDEGTHHMPEEGAGGAVGGVVEVVSLSAIPTETPRDHASAMGMQFGGSMVPAFSPGYRLIYGVDVLGYYADRRYAALELMLDVGVPELAFSRMMGPIDDGMRLSRIRSIGNCPCTDPPLLKIPRRPAGPPTITESLSVASENPVRRVIYVNRAGEGVSSSTLARQGTSPLVGNFYGLSGASLDEIVSRLPANWKWSPQRGGNGIRFFDEAGFERIRMHGPNSRAPAGSNSCSGWTLRIMDRAGNYYDAAGRMVPYRANEGHIPIYGNPNAP